MSLHENNDLLFSFLWFGHEPSWTRYLGLWVGFNTNFNTSTLSYNRRRTLTEDDLWRKTTFDRRRTLTEDDHWQKTTFHGRWPLIGCIIYYLKKMYTTHHRIILLTWISGFLPNIDWIIQLNRKWVIFLKYGQTSLANKLSKQGHKW